MVMERNFDVVGFKIMMGLDWFLRQFVVLDLRDFVRAWGVGA